jgi:hypothetical protein
MIQFSYCKTSYYTFSIKIYAECVNCLFSNCYAVLLCVVIFIDLIVIIQMY